MPHGETYASVLIVPEDHVRQGEDAIKRQLQDRLYEEARRGPVCAEVRIERTRPYWREDLGPDMVRLTGRLQLFRVVTVSQPVYLPPTASAINRYTPPPRASRGAWLGKSVRRFISLFWRTK